MATVPSNAVSLLRSHKDQITDRGRREFAKLREALFDNNDLEQANSIYPRICDNIQTQIALTEISNELTLTQTDLPEFIIGTELLYNAFEKMCSIPTESILYAVGNKFGNSYSIERLIELKLDKSEMAYASANPTFSSRALIELEKYGTLLTCYFHAHPGNGKNANRPSGVDYSNQKRLENGDYNTIGGIFSRDGYLRFFSDKLQYKVIISGKGVEYVSKNVYRLTAIS